MRVKMGVDELKGLFDLTGKVAVVTGGSGGAGKAISVGLGGCGGYEPDIVHARRDGGRGRKGREEGSSDLLRCG